MKPFREKGVAFGREHRFDFRCSYNITTSDIGAEKNIENEEYVDSTFGDGKLQFELNFFENNKFETITSQTNVTIGNSMFFEIRAISEVPGLNFFVHTCRIKGQLGQEYTILENGCPDQYTKTQRYGDYSHHKSVRFSYTGKLKVIEMIRIYGVVVTYRD